MNVTLAIVSMIALHCTQASVSSKTNITFPVKLDRAGFEHGIWDVGPLYISGQPSEEAFRKLAREGVKTVVCIRGQLEMDNRQIVPFDEEALLKKLGIRYVHIPLGTLADYKPSVLDQFAKAIQGAHTRVLLHCTVAWRASYLWTSYLYKYKKMSLDDAIRNGRAMAMDPDSIGTLLGADFTYSAKPLKGEPASIEPGVFSKPGSKIVVHEPRVIVPVDRNNHLAFAMWDTGTVLNSSQPDEQWLRKLASEGVKTVINIRTDEEMEQIKRDGFDEEAVAKSLGLKYVRVPMESSDFSPENLAKVAEALQDSEGRVLLHCRTANRTSYVFGAYLARYQGLDINEAAKYTYSMRPVNTQAALLGKLLGADIVFKIKPKAIPGSCGGG